MVKKILINYADGHYIESQKENSKSGREIAKFDDVIPYSRNDIDTEFLERNHIIFSQKRGAGYWLWKPYFILKTLYNLSDGDILFYSDSGSTFIHDIDPLISVLEQSQKDMICFKIDRCLEYQFTKLDCFIELKSPQFHSNSEQIMSSFHIMRKSKQTIEFYERFLFYCQKIHMITDLPNIFGSLKHPEFRDHRHDQSIFSLLCKKYEIPQYPDPTQYCLDPILRPYPQILNHHRNRS